MVQFNYQAPWVPVLNNCIDNELAATDNKPPFTTFQIATIDSKTGYPNSRTVIFRGWLFNNKSSNVITFTTDKRMDKYQELLQNDKVEAVFWFSNIRKQIRFRGRARILDDEHHPNIDIKHMKEEINGNLVSHQSSTSLSTQSTQKQPIKTPLLSPTYAANNTAQEEFDAADFVPPTDEEWDQELQRYWDGLSKPMKTSFRKPAPKSPMTEENQKLISKIQRGVDGKKSDDGLKNFAVVGIFVNYVDYFEQDKDKRFIYELEEENQHQWTETEVCP